MIEIAFVRNGKQPLYLLAEEPLRDFYNEEDLNILPTSKARFMNETIEEESCYDYSSRDSRFYRRKI